MEQLKYSEKAAIPFSSFLHAEKGMDSSEQLQQPNGDNAGTQEEAFTLDFSLCLK